MINSLIELVFEEVAPEKLNELINEVLQNQPIESIFQSGVEIINTSSGTIDYLELLRSVRDDSTIFVNCSSLSMGKVLFKKTLVLVIKYSEHYDLSVVFSQDDVLISNSSNPVREILKEARRLSINGKISSYFCGFEPASDIETRFFTNDELGPLLSFY